jgi:hypothetical protein
MIPDRFVTEFPARCLTLLESFESDATRQDLVGTFAIMLASSMLTIPLERLNARHPLHGAEHDLVAGLKQIAGQRWVEVGEWAAASPVRWRFARIMGDPNDVAGWKDERDVRSMTEEANTIGRRRAAEVLRAVRNALAHGSIVYLNEDGYEVAGARVEWLGFLSRYEETPEQREAGETYRLVAVREGDFLAFVKAWATLIGQLGIGNDLRAA